jgi:hypothetical protein
MKATDPVMSTPQALLKWADLMMASTKSYVLSHERSTVAIPPFEAT